VTLGIPREHTSGGSYWLAPLDCHSRVVVSDFENLGCEYKWWFVLVRSIRWLQMVICNVIFARMLVYEWWLVEVGP